MMTDNEAAKIAGTLSAEEWVELLSTSRGFNESLIQRAFLLNKKLVAFNHEMTVVTNLDKQVLAAQASPHPEGQPPAESETTEDIISWKHFKNRDNSLFIAWLNDQCEVLFNGLRVRHIDSDTSVSLEHQRNPQKMHDDDELKVRWLPQPPPATAADSGAVVIMTTSSLIMPNICLVAG